LKRRRTSTGVNIRTKKKTQRGRLQKAIAATVGRKRELEKGYGRGDHRLIFLGSPVMTQGKEGERDEVQKKKKIRWFETEKKSILENVSG